MAVGKGEEQRATTARRHVQLGTTFVHSSSSRRRSPCRDEVSSWLRKNHILCGWVQGSDGEWQWQDDADDDDASWSAPAVQTQTDPTTGFVTQTNLLDGIEALKYSDAVDTVASTPTLPSGQFRPKQSLGQNYLRDGNTVAKIVRAYIQDATLRLATTMGETAGTAASKEDRPESKARDVSHPNRESILRAVELGPGAGALTDRLVEALGVSSRDGHNDDDNSPSLAASAATPKQFPCTFQCIEIDGRAVQLLTDKHPHLRIRHEDVLQTNYVQLAEEEGGPLSVVGNLPYYITSQILFALADASHFGAVLSATVTMQWEVAQRIVAPTHCKDYGILSVVFQLYGDCKLHFKIPPTVFYPQPKVDSALVGLQFVGPAELRRRLGGVQPRELRRVVTTCFQQRRKTIRKSLQKLIAELPSNVEERLAAAAKSPPGLPECLVEARRQEKERRRQQPQTGNPSGSKNYYASSMALPVDFLSKRPEELTAGQFVELTRLLYGPQEGTMIGGDADGDDAYPLGNKVWRKLKHGSDE